MSEITKVTGTIHKLLPIESFPSGYEKQSLIVRTSGQYPQFVNIEFGKDKIDLLHDCKEGDEVSVNYNLNGRIWTSPQGEDKYFNSVLGWKIEKLDDHEPTVATGSKASTATAKETFFDEEDSDDLPF